MHRSLENKRGERTLKKFKLFDMNKPGRGISKSQALREDNVGVSGFFKTFKNRFWNISSLNILYIFANFPFIFGIIALSGNLNLETTAPVSPLYSQLFGISQYGNTPFVSVLSSVIGGNGTLSVPSTATKVFALLTLLVIFTFGIANTGATYVLRGFVRGEPVYLLSDFVHAVKKNLRQAIILGFLDSLFIFALAYGLMTYYINAGTYIMNVMFVAELLILLVYLTMRFYMYILLVTFDLSTFKILKNSFIFAVVGYKRNILAWIAIILVLIFSFYIFFTLPFLGIALPFIITLAALMFVGTYAAYPVIKQYMIDPYYKSDKIAFDDEQPVFKDRG